MMARRFNIPAIFCCETYKFSDKVQLDSICWNEIGDPSELTRGHHAATGAAAAAAAAQGPPAAAGAAVAAAAATRQPKLLNIRYDLTPMRYVSLVITEVGMIPPTSVPVLIREYNKDDNAWVDF
jgi:translation initiation factor eIF-2B subunit delta